MRRGNPGITNTREKHKYYVLYVLYYIMYCIILCIVPPWRQDWRSAWCRQWVVRDGGDDVVTGGEDVLSYAGSARRIGRKSDNKSRRPPRKVPSSRRHKERLLLPQSQKPKAKSALATSFPCAPNFTGRPRSFRACRDDADLVQQESRTQQSCAALLPS